MKRIPKLLRTGCLLCGVVIATQLQQIAAQSLPDNYAESVMILLLSDDARTEVSLRLARFPLTGNGTVWLHVATPDGAWSLADESFELDTQTATPVNEDAVRFSAHQGSQSLDFQSTRRDSGMMQGRATGSFLVSATRHPELVPGDVPVRLELNFTARNNGYHDNGRWEMTGFVFGTVTVGNNTIFTGAEGKWHEQTGPRNGFAPAFRYFNVQSEYVAVLAIQYANRFRGYAMLADGFHDLTEVSIAAPDGSSDRSFHLTLDNGQVIEGTSHQVQEWSVPIEGVRRPGSSVVVDSNIGQLVGSLNDWTPGQE